MGVPQIIQSSWIGFDGKGRAQWFCHAMISILTHVTVAMEGFHNSNHQHIKMYMDLWMCMVDFVHDFAYHLL